LSREAEALKVAISMAQSKDLQEKLRVLRHDPELEPTFNEIAKEGPAAMIKYYTDPEFLRKVGDRLGDEVQRMVDAMAQSQGPKTALVLRRTVSGSIPPADEGLTSGADFGALGLRLIGSAMMVHNGLDKLADPAGFAKFVVQPYLPIPEALCLPATYAAAGIELIGPVLLLLGIATRVASVGLLATMGGAIIFHLGKTGLEGFPFAVVEAHQYAYETSVLYAAIYAYLAIAGPGKFSVEEQFGQD